MTNSAAATCLSSLLVSACVTAAEPPTGVEPSGSLVLPLGASAPIGSAGLRIGFDAVTTDSRCPKGVQCVWAGQATVRIWLQPGNGIRQTLELHLPPQPGPAPQALGLRPRLVRLDPYPVGGRPVVAANYAATLAVDVASDTDSNAAAER